MNSLRSLSNLGRMLLVAIVIGSLVQAGNSMVQAQEGHDHGHHHTEEATPATAEQPRELMVITVSEYGEAGFAIDIAPIGILDQLHVGQTYDVLVVNAGGIAHELMVMPVKMASMGHEHAEHLSLLNITTDQLSRRGEVVKTELVFPNAGDFAFVCHLHPGMEMTVTVTS